MNTTCQQGISILELMLVLALLGLTASLAAPAMQDFVASNRSQATKYQLERAIHQARSMAVTQKERVLLCGSQDMLNCHPNWSKGWIIRKLADIEPQVVTQLDATDLSLHWSGFQNGIVFEAGGIGLTTNGRFVLCRQQRVDWQLVLNRQGRLRAATADENRQQDGRCT